MFKSLITSLKHEMSLVRSLSAAQLRQALSLVLLSTVLPMLLAFGCVSLLFSSLGIHDFSVWSIVPVVIYCSLSKLCFYAKKLNKQAQQQAVRTN